MSEDPRVTQSAWRLAAARPAAALLLQVVLAVAASTLTPKIFARATDAATVYVRRAGANRWLATCP
jgi:hypothetical protein